MILLVDEENSFFWKIVGAVLAIDIHILRTGIWIKAGLLTCSNLFQQSRIDFSQRYRSRFVCNISYYKKELEAAESLYH